MTRGALAVLAILLGQADPSLVQEVVGTAAPVATRAVQARYPDDMLPPNGPTIVKLECLVGEDGSVSDIQVRQGLGPALDEAAVAALKQWTFKPGMKDGKPVPARVAVEVSFEARFRGPRLGSPEIFQVGQGVSAPRLRHEARPTYPIEAKQAGTQGVITMECVVLPDGTVGDARVTKGLGPLLDAEAIRTLREWRFYPAEKAGKPVPVQVTVEMGFTLR